MRGYHDAHYVNPAIVVAASGSVDHDHLCELTARHFRPEPGAVVRRADLSVPEASHLARFTQKDTEQYHVCLGGPGPKRGDPDRYAVFVVDTILGGSWSSHLFQEVREKRGLAYSVYSYTSLYADAGLTAVYFGSRQEAVEEAMRVILDVLARPRGRHDGHRHHARQEPPQGAARAEHGEPRRAHAALGRAVLLEQPILTVDEVLERIDAVDSDAVIAAVRRYYDPETWSTACIGPQPEPFAAVTQDFAWEER